MRPTVLLLATLLLCACGDDEGQAPGLANTEGGPESEHKTATVTATSAEPLAVAPDVNDDVPEPGRAVYEHYCRDCHNGGGGHPGTMRLAVRFEEPVLRMRIDLAPDYVKWVVRNGYQMMPPFRPTEITDAELDALANYVAAGTIARN